MPTPLDTYKALPWYSQMNPLEFFPVIWNTAVGSVQSISYSGIVIACFMALMSVFVLTGEFVHRLLFSALAALWGVLPTGITGPLSSWWPPLQALMRAVGGCVMFIAQNFIHPKTLTDLLAGAITISSMCLGVRVVLILVGHIPGKSSPR